MKIPREFKVGIIFIAAIAFFIWGFNYLKGKDVFQQQRKFYAIYDKVDGLVPASIVIINGLQVGSVDDVYFYKEHSGKILVSFLITDDLPIPVNSIARIISYDLIGTKAIKIILKESDIYAENGDTLASEVQASLGEEVNRQMLPLKLKAENLMLSIDSVLEVIRYVFNEETRENLAKSFENIQLTIANLKSTTHNIDTLVYSQKNRLDRIIGNIELITDNLKNNKEEINNILVNFSAISDSLAKAKISTTLLKANKTLEDVAAIVEKINEGEGTLGLLIDDDDLYKQIEDAVDDVDQLIEDIKYNPNRYLHFSVFGRNPKKNIYIPREKEKEK